MSTDQPTVESPLVYASRPRRILIAGSILAVFLSTVGLVFEPDPSTGIKPLPSDYLWVVIPGTIVLAVLLWRATKARIESGRGGIELFRVAGHEYLPWSDIRGFEVHPTPGRQGFAVRVRRHNEGLVTVRSEINVRPLRDREEAKRRARRRAVALRDQLATDRAARFELDRSSSSLASGTASGPASGAASGVAFS